MLLTKAREMTVITRIFTNFAAGNNMADLALKPAQPIILHK